MAPRIQHLAKVLLITLLASACGGGNGGGSSTPSSPTPTTTPVATTTIAITAAGVSPRDITVSVGSRVTFINNDSRPHEMASDPHPEHTQCPEITIGFINTGQTLLTSNLTTARRCGFHDHNQPTVTSLQGTITIQ